MRRFSSFPARRAFTLIEILIVIAIIGLLAAILFPVFGSSREKARQASCMSNLHQIGLGIAQYTQDYDERYPTVYIDIENNPRDFWLLIQPYVKSDEIFHCPSDDAEQCDPANGCTTSGKELSYGVNSGPLYAWDDSTTPTTPLNEGGIYTAGTELGAYGESIASDQNPSRSFLAADGFSVLAHLMTINGYQPQSNNEYQRQTPPPQSNSAWRHGNWRNVLYGDGHVKMVQWHAGLTPWGGVMMLPKHRADYESYCLNPDKMIGNWFSPDYPIEQRCGDVPGQIESLVTNWEPD